MQLPSYKTHQRAEFYLAPLDNRLLVEVNDDEVTIRATRNNLSTRRKEYFVRELAAEAWVQEDCESGDVSWVVDAFWPMSSRQSLPQSDRFMERLLVGAGVLWLGLMAVAFCGGI